MQQTESSDNRIKNTRLSAWLPWIVIPLLALPAIWPFVHTGLPHSADGALHLLRLVVLDANIQSGMLYPRWMPELFLGYGYPLLNFYGPTTYYLAELLHIFGLGHTYALMGVFILSIIGSGYGAYLLASDMFDDQATTLRPWPALIAAVAYMYAPYFLTNVYMRGALGEVGAQALLPWIFWSFRRLLRADRPAMYILPAALSLGGLAATHNITLLWIPLVLLSYIGVLWWRNREGRRLLWTMGGGAAAMGVSAFFWLPLIGERRYLSDVAFDISATFVGENVWTWRNFLDLHLPFEYTLSIPFQIGLAQLPLAVAGFVLLRRRSAEWWYWLIVTLIGMLGISQMALPLWMSNEILLIAQFPWRLLSVISLPLALFTGAIITRLRAGPLLIVASSVLLVLVVLNNRPILDQIRPLITDNRDLTVANVTQFEADTNAYGTSSSSEFMPRWASDGVFAPMPPMDPAEPTPQLTLQAASPFHIEAMVSTPAATTLRFSNFYFPGWQATVNGAAIEPHPDPARGLLALGIPAGESQISLTWRGTPLQRIADLISILTLAALVGLVLFVERRHPLRAVLLVVAPMLLLIFGLTVFFKPPPDGADFRQPTTALASETLELLGVRSRMVDEQTIDLLPYWLVKQTPDDMRLVWSFLDADGKRIPSADGQPYYHAVQAAHWSPNTIVDDAYQLALPPGLAAGSYPLQAQLMHGDDLVSPQPVTVAILDLPATPTDARHPATARNAHFGAAIILDGLDAKRNGQMLSFDGAQPPLVKPGDQLEYRLHWRANDETGEAIEENYHAFVHLLDIDQQSLVQRDQLPGPVFSPPLLWNPHRAQPDVYWFTVPDDTLGGLYWPHAGLYSFATQERLSVTDDAGNSLGDRVVLPPIKVVNNRNDDGSSAVDQAVDVRFDGLATLTGYDVALPADGLHPGDTMTVTLRYQADEEVENRPDYTQFVHLYDPALGMAAQRDRQPRNGGNPTSTWMSDEVITDEIVLTIAEDAALGTYRLLFGLYDAQAGAVRVPLYDADGQRLENDQIALTALEIQLP